MPKTVEEIKAEVTALVKSQGNQGAISLGTVLDDITELAGEGGGGGGESLPFKVFPFNIDIDPDGGGTPQVQVTTTQEEAKAIFDYIQDAPAALHLQIGGQMGLATQLMLPTLCTVVNTPDGAYAGAQTCRIARTGNVATGVRSIGVTIIIDNTGNVTATYEEIQYQAE